MEWDIDYAIWREGGVKYTYDTLFNMLVWGDIEKDKIEYLEWKGSNKMQEKTFREVIADIKEGQVWECTRKNARVKRVRLNGTVDEGLLTFDYGEMITEDKSAIRCTDRFILRRKEYTFDEVYKAYTEGKEIESVHSGYRYKKENGKDLFFSKISEMWEENNEFKTKEIMNMWYIND